MWVKSSTVYYLMFESIFRIDALLGGGLRGGKLTELVGSSSSGKTQVRTLQKCPLCSNEPESNAHLFFSCRKSLQVWAHIRDLAPFRWRFTYVVWL